MKEVTVKIYKLDELPLESQEKAVEKLYDLNIDYEWYDHIFEDAKTIGIKIDSFDLDRHSHCNLSAILIPDEVCSKILENHGKTCDTFKLAETYLALLQKAIDSENEDLQETLEEEFLQQLSEEYRIILEKEYEYLTSESAIRESITANDYDFTINGEIY